MSDPLSPGGTNVAVACQGGGSHTAFTAGVLTELFAEWPEDHRLVGISGTSGGAVCGLAAWYGLLADGEDPGDCLRTVWDELAADDPLDRTANEWVVGTSKLEHGGAPVPEFSPYHSVGSDAGKRRIQAAMEAAVDFGRIPELAGPAAPKLAVGTVDVNGGEFEVFCDGAITPTVVLASAAVPDLFEAVEIDDHYHWDGLFSQNPPIHELMREPVERKPDELWVVQINPQQREGEPTSLRAIKDRRNELAGNLSLNQELRFIERVNDWIDSGDLVCDDYTHTEIRRIALDRRLDYASKLDRSPSLLSELIAEGRETAGDFLAEYPGEG